MAVLHQQLECLYTDPDPQRKAAANTWLLQFQSSAAAWRVGRLLLLQQQQELQLMGAQTLAWKIENEGNLLPQQHKNELAAALFAAVRHMQQQQQQQPQQQQQLSFAVGGRIGHCLAALAFQRMGEQQQQQQQDDIQQQDQQQQEQQQQQQQQVCEPLRQLLAFGLGDASPCDEGSSSSMSSIMSRIASISNSSSSSSKSDVVLDWSCWVSLAALAAVPALLHASDVPSRGGRRFADGQQTRGVSDARFSVLSFGCGILAAAAAAATSNSSSSSSSGISSSSSSSMEARCGEGALLLLTAWLEGAESTEVPVAPLCSSLGLALPCCMQESSLTDCLIAALPRLPAFMALWSVQTGGGGVEAFWQSPSLPTDTPEGELLQQLLHTFDLLAQQVAQDLPQLQQQPRSSNTAVFIRWAGVLLTVLEGHPQLLLLPSAAAAGRLLLLLWQANPLTWLRVSAFWVQVKEMRRDGLLQQELLQQLAVSVSPCCMSSLLQHSRRSNPCWGEDAADEWAAFVESAGDVVADLLSLHQACGEQQGTLFLLSLSEVLGTAIDQGDACGIEAILLLSDAVVEALNAIPESLAAAFLSLQRLPQDSHVAVAAALLLRKAAIHFTEDPEYDGLQSCLSPTTCCSLSLLAAIWLVAMHAMARLLLLQPSLISETILQLATWGGHHLGAVTLEFVQQQTDAAAAAPAAAAAAAAAEGDSPAAHAQRRLQQLRELHAFVAAAAPSQQPQVDGTLHAAIVKLLQHFPRQQMQCLFCELLQQTADGICSSSSSSCSSSRRQQLAARLLARLECCAAALFSGRVEVCRSNSAAAVAAAAAAAGSETTAASDCIALFLLQRPQEQQRFLQQHGADCSLQPQQQQQQQQQAADRPLWVYLLPLLQEVLLHCASAPPILGAGRDRVSFSQLLDLRAHLPQPQQQQQQQQEETKGVLFVRALRCMRLLLAVLGAREDAQDLWGAVICTVEACLAAAAGAVQQQQLQQQQQQQQVVQQQPATAAALQGCSIVLLSDLLRISAAKPQLQQLVRQRISADAAAALELYVHLGPLLPRDMADAYLPLLEFLSAFASASQQQAAAAAAAADSGTSAAAAEAAAAESSEFFAAPLYGVSLRLCAEILKGDDPEVAKRCLSYLYVCCSSSSSAQEQQMQQHLHQLIPAVLASLGVWGTETLAVLWKLLAQLVSRFNPTVLAAVSSWLRDTSSSSSSSGSQSRSPLQQLEPVQQQLLLHCLEVFRGARIRQLLQDMCLIAAGIASPADALVAYEFALSDAGVGGARRASPAAAAAAADATTASGTAAHPIEL
ncbi:hypothetical protein Emed_000988 [Eimeria media]